MLVTTRRFGEIDIPQDKIITMARPLLGFEQLKKFCLIESEDMQPFFWLQSTEEPEIAFVIVNPKLFFSDYKIEVNRAEIAELRISEVSAVETYVIVTLPHQSNRISVNLQGPILINTANNLARQLVMVNSEYGIKHYILDELDKTETEPTEVLEPAEML